MKTELLDLSLVGARRLGATVIRAQAIKPSRLAPTLPFGRNRPKLCFQSERSIELVSMGPALLEALLAGDYARAERSGRFQIPTDLRLSQRTLQMRLRQIRANPEV